MKKNKIICQELKCKEEGTQEMRGMWLCSKHYNSLVYDMCGLALKHPPAEEEKCL